MEQLTQEQKPEASKFSSEEQMLMLDIQRKALDFAEKAASLKQTSMIDAFKVFKYELRQLFEKYKEEK